MNTAQTPLPLRDIHLPESISFWPPAIGWWMILALLLLLMSLLFLWRRWRRQPRLKQAARRAYLNLKMQYRLDKNSTAALQALSAFLRRTAVSYYGRSMASIRGDVWLEALDNLTAGKSQPIWCNEESRRLLQAAYQAHAQIDVESMLARCERWVKALPKHAPRRNQSNA